MIPNGADLDIMAPGPKDNQVRRRLGLEGKFVVSYFGAHGRANRVGQLLDVAERLKGAAPDVRIMLVGDGMEKPALVEDARGRGLDNVIFVDSVPKAQVCDYINASDVCTAVLMKNDTFKTVYPNKVFDYMSCKRPTIVAIDRVARKLVEDAGAGLYAEAENPEAFIRATMTLKNNPALMAEMGERGYSHVREHYSRDGLARRYLAVLGRLTRGRT
jgi:glycosyltransferase involved in cell wall biosynthesis